MIHLEAMAVKKEPSSMEEVHNYEVHNYEGSDNFVDDDQAKGDDNEYGH